MLNAYLNVRMNLQDFYLQHAGTAVVSSVTSLQLGSQLKPHALFPTLCGCGCVGVLRGFRVSSHSPKTCRLGQTDNLNCPQVLERVRVVVGLCVSPVIDW